jgi:LemA protein
MKSFRKPILALCALTLTLSLFSGCGYNDIQTKDEDINNKWAQVETQLQRRSDLIPNLVKVVQSYAKHERGVFQDIAEARAKMGGAIQSNDPNQVAAADGQFHSALSRLMMVVENYPTLKADQQYTRLMDELSGTENRIAVSRKDYNDTVRDYNAFIRQIPTNFTAMVIHAKTHAYYNPPEESQKAPVVNME